METKLTNQESLAIITKMIQQSKSNVQAGSFYFLFWGWVTFFAYTAHYVLLVFIDYPKPYLVWLITIPAGIISAVYGYKKSQTSVVKTHLDYIFGQNWLAFLIPLLAIIFFGYKVGFENITGLILLLVGSAVFISSRILKFNPSTYGSIVIWAMAILALIYNDEQQYLFGAIATILGYLVPGYLLKKKETNE
jgi:hypothetical protein